MTDYLTMDRAKLPKVKHPTNGEILDDIHAKKCKTCAHYGFYFCNALQKGCAPEGVCINMRRYAVKPALKELTT